jgi:hypothetical protein
MSASHDLSTDAALVSTKRRDSSFERPTLPNYNVRRHELARTISYHGRGLAVFSSVRPLDRRSFYELRRGPEFCSALSKLISLRADNIMHALVLLIFDATS